MIQSAVIHIRILTWMKHLRKIKMDDKVKIEKTTETLMTLGHVLVKEVGEDNYIVNNTINNKYIRFGVKEVNYLLELKGISTIGLLDEENKLTEQQKQLLYNKFEEWDLIELPKKQKKKLDLSNIVLLYIKPDGWIQKVLSILQIFITKFGFFLFLLATFYVVYAFGFESEALLHGVLKFEFNATNIIAIYLFTIITSILHELFHATACYKYTGKCGRMGIKLFYLLPAYFCDVSNIYMVADRKKAVIVSGAGLMLNHIAGAFTLFLYCTLYNNGLDYSMLLLLFTYNLFTIIFNLLPISKFDGYWIIKSLTGIDNLYDKSLMLFILFCFNIKKFMKIKNSPIKKGFVTFYGAFLYFFHWLLWLYGIIGFYITLNNYLEINITRILAGIVAVIGLTNCITFTKKYIKLYQNYNFKHQIV